MKRILLCLVSLVLVVSCGQDPGVGTTAIAGSDHALFPRYCITPVSITSTTYCAGGERHFKVEMIGAVDSTFAPPTFFGSQMTVSDETGCTWATGSLPEVAQSPGSHGYHEWADAEHTLYRWVLDFTIDELAYNPDLYPIISDGVFEGRAWAEGLCSGFAELQWFTTFSECVVYNVSPECAGGGGGGKDPEYEE